MGGSGTTWFTGQSFTTGDQGATISEIVLRLGGGGSGISVSLRDDNAGVPGDLVATFTNPGSLSSHSWNTFTAPNNTQVAANTTYWVSIHEGIDSNRRTLVGANSDDQTGEMGWSIGNGSKARSSESGDWVDSTTRLVQIKGTLTDTTAPTFSSASVNGDKLTITFNEALGAASNLSNNAFTVKKTPSGGTEADVSLSSTAPSISGSTVVLTLATAVVPSDGSVKVSYTKPTTGPNNKIVDATGNETDSFSDQTVANNTGPTITIAAGTSPVTEGTAATFTVTADSTPSANLTVNLTVADASGSDFVASGDEGSKTVTINSGATTATYSVTTQSDTTDEPKRRRDGHGGLGHWLHRGIAVLRHCHRQRRRRSG